MSPLRQLIFLSLSASLPVASQTISMSSPGLLSASGEFPSRSQLVRIEGPLNAADLHFITDTAEEIGTLDLSGASITPYSGPRLGANVTASSADALPPYVFAGLKASCVRLPQSLAAIGDGAFLGSAVTEVTVPSGVVSIGNAAFAECRSLVSAVLPQSVTVIPGRLFEGCASLSSVSLDGAAIDSIGCRAFFGCLSLSSCDFGQDLKAIGPEAFARSGIERIDLTRADGVRIHSRAFSGDSCLVNVKLPADALLMGEGCFFGCNALENVELPGSDIAPMAFTGASSLAGIDIAEGTGEVGQLAFAGTTAAGTVTLPSTLGHIGEGAFERMSSLSSVDASMLDEVPALGDGVWSGVDVKSVGLSVSPGMENLFLATPQWQDFKIIPLILTDAADGIAAGAGDSGIRVRYAGGILEAECPEGLTSIDLFTPAGAPALHHDCKGATGATVDTRHLDGRLYIVRISSSGSEATLKIAN